MHHCQDVKDVFVVSVDYAIRESANQNPTKSGTYLSPPGRKHQSRLKRVGPFRICFTVYAWICNGLRPPCQPARRQHLFSTIFIVLSMGIVAIDIVAPSCLLLHNLHSYPFSLRTNARVVSMIFFFTPFQVRLPSNISGIGSSSASSKYINPRKGKDTSDTENFDL